ncbi:hypothetical protein MMC18_006537 [Xylographa bjoerkii]|nr:hypothetical protein [Xylographa bjoerkii]
MAPFIYDDYSYTSPRPGLAEPSGDTDKTIPIAIVGMSCRFPGDATDVEELWKMCAESRDAWGPIPADRFNLNGYYHPDSGRPGTTYVRGGHFLKEDITRFDAPFFNITRDEAAAMDPQQRLLLECSYEALENAGTTIKDVVGSDTSVYMGSFCRDWTDILNRDIEALPFYQATGTGQALLANRLSYFYDLKGPSISIDTACSSSLVAIHLACQSLRAGESKRAIVGGSNVILSHETMISMSRMRFLSPDGRCFTYDHRANGYSRGEGAACLILKPLEEALRDGDTIRGIIRNTGTNQDGKTNGITLPSSEAQERLMRSVYTGAGLDPLYTTYVEAHGTGTAVGDPLEAAALSRVFGPGRSHSEPLVVGSVKTNIGHLEGASGLAGLIHTVLMLENGLISPNLNFEKANAGIPLYDWKLKVPTAIESWPKTGVPRASVCNYGYGGSNAHVIVDSASHYLDSRGLKGAYRTLPPILHSLCQKSNPFVSILEETRARVFVFSAFDEESGKAQAARFASYLRKQGGSTSVEFFDDLAFTLGKRRSILPFRVAVSACSVSQLLDAVSSDHMKYSKATKTPVVGFVFTGQGAQHYAMGRELIETYPVFQDSLIKSSKYIKIFGASWSLLDELAKTAEESQIGLGYLSQPLCTAIQIALVDLLASWNVHPASVTGHSSGEIAAAYAAGALSHEAALAVAYYRGLAGPAIKQKHPLRKGSMLAVGLSKDETQNLLSDVKSGKALVACINSPSSVTVSGDDCAVEELLHVLQKKKVFARKLNVEVAYHSHHLNCIGDDYLDALQHIQVQDCQKADFFSSVTGRRTKLSELGPAYWVRNMLNPVEFSNSLQALCLDVNSERRERGLNSAIDILIELGPHSALAGPIKQTLQADEQLRSSSIRYYSALVRNQSAVDTTLHLASQLFKSGCPVDFEAINNPDRRCSHKVLVDLPTYPWNHSCRYTAESRESRLFRSRSTPRSDILGAPVRNSIPTEPRWRNYVRPTEIPWVRDHRIQSDMIYPAGGFIAMAIEAASQDSRQRGLEVSGYRLREITIGRALVIPETEVETMLCFRPSSGISGFSSEIWNEFRIYSVTDTDNWTEHCRGLISIQKESIPNEVDGQRLMNEEKASYATMISEAESTCTTDVNIRKLYSDLKSAGLHYGPTFAIMEHARAAPYQSVGKLVIYDTAAVMPSHFEYPFVVHPGTIDGCIQTLFPGMSEAGPIEEAFMPTSIEEIFVSAKITRTPGHGFRAYAKSTQTCPRQSVSSITVFNEEVDDLEPMIIFKGLTCSSLPKASAEEAVRELKLCFQTRWTVSPDFLSLQQAEELCRGNSCFGEYSHISAYVDCLAHKNPHLKCLEVNGGTGDSTRSILNVLMGTNGKAARLTSYEFTDMTTKQFEDIKMETQMSNDLLSLTVLNVESDLHAQGFEPGSYDLIVVTPTRCDYEVTARTMSAFHKLLTPDGRLIIVGTTQRGRLARADDHAQHDILSIAESTGFELSVSLGAAKGKHQNAMMVFKPTDIETMWHPEVLIIAEKRTSYIGVNYLKAIFNDLGAVASISTLSDANPGGKLCIILSDIEQNILSNPSSSQFESIQRISAKSEGTLWITRGATIESEHPDANLMAGLARTVRLESSSSLATLDLDTRNPLQPEACAQAVLDVFRKVFIPNRKDEVIDLEYAERDGLILIPRIIEHRKLNKSISSTTQGPFPEDQPFDQACRALTIEVSAPGQIDSLQFIDDDRMDSELPEDHVVIQVKASGVNSTDVLVATARITLASLGQECSGIISTVGKAVTTLKVGDRVICQAQGTISNFIRQQASKVQILPDTVSYELGASLPSAYTTAYHSLFKVANLEREDTILVHAAAGSLGQALVRFSLMIGAEVFATVENLEEKRLLIEDLKISESHIFSIHGGAFAQGIKRITRDKGIDVIISSVSGMALRQTLECIAPFGRFIELGTQNTTSNTRLEMGLFAKNITFSAVNMDELVSERPKQVTKAFAEAMSLIREGRVSLPPRVTTFGIVEVDKALRMVQSGKHVGKVVVMPQPNEVVKVIPRITSHALLRADCSYLLVGGLGGLGRAIAIWMVAHGARNLIFASRSGLAKPSARTLVVELEKKGTKVAVFSCDISEVEQFDDLLARSAETMPPIRGVVQAAMIIKNSFFQTMLLSDYTASLAPKVRGTWNLHNRLSKSTLDFFILLSSAVGTIGNPSQAAYAAASTFQDAFAAYRSNLGLPGISLDLGMIDDVGYVAENASVQRGLAKLGFEAVKESELMAMIQDAITHPIRTPETSSTISGLGTYTPGDLALRPALADPRFSHFRRMGEHLVRKQNNSSSSSGNATEAFHDLLRRAQSVEDAAGCICEAMREKLAGLLMVPLEEVSVKQSMAEAGLDSLVAVQMRAWLTSATEAPVSLLEVMANVPLMGLAGMMAGRSRLLGWK